MELGKNVAIQRSRLYFNHFSGLVLERSIDATPNNRVVDWASRRNASSEDRQDIEDHILNCALCFAEASEFLVVEFRNMYRIAERVLERKTNKNGHRFCIAKFIAMLGPQN